jgi:NADH:ubiquinone oxidoreductase subunit K
MYTYHPMGYLGCIHSTALVVLTIPVVVVAAAAVAVAVAVVVVVFDAILERRGER